MNKNNHTQPESLENMHSESKEELCDYLRKIRQSKHISLEKMAKDTKLNLDYLYALEQGDYQALPAEAYVRIYIRSIAKYLKIAPDMISSLYQDTNSANSEAEKPVKAGMTYAPHQSKAKPIGIAAFIIIAIVIFSFFRTGRRNNIEPDSTIIPSTADSTREKMQQQISEEQPLDTAEILKEEIAVADTKTTVMTETVSVNRKTTVKTKPVEKDTTEPEQANRKAEKLNVSEKDSVILLTVKCKDNESWIMVHRDFGHPWRQTLSKGQTKAFRAEKTFHVALGRAENIKVYHNNKEINLHSSKGVFRFSLNRNGLKPISRKFWFKIFHGQQQ